MKALGRPLGVPPKPVTETEAVAVTEAGTEAISAQSDESLHAQGGPAALALFGPGDGDADPAHGRLDSTASVKEPVLPAFISIPLIDKTEFLVARSQVDEWMGLYPAVDVEQELRNYLGWTMANPKKRKTRKGILASVNYWLADKQNKPRRSQQGSFAGRGSNGGTERFGAGDWGGPEFNPEPDPEGK